MNSFLRKLAKGLIFAVGGVVVLVLLLFLLLHTPPVLKKVASFAESAASDALEGTLEIKGVEGTVFGTLTAREVVLRGADGERIVSVDAVDIEISFAALLTRTISVDVHGEGLVGYLERREDGSVNLMDLFGEETEDTGPSPVSLDIRVDAPEGVIVWRDRSVPGDDDPLAELKADFAMDTLDDAVKLVPNPENLARAVPHSAVLRELAVALRVTVDREANTNVGVSKLEGRAVVPGVTGTREIAATDFRLSVREPGLKLSLAELRIADWLEIRDARAEVSNTDEEDFELHVQKIELTDDVARFAGADLEIRSGVVLELHASGHREDGTLIWAQLEPTAAEGSVTAAGRIENWMTPGPETKFDIALLVDKLQPAAVVGIAEPLERVSLAASLEAQGVDPEKMSVTGRVALRDTDIGAYRISTAYIDATVADGNYRFDRVVLTSPYASASARGHLQSDGSVEVVARATSTDVGAKVSKDLFGTELASRADIEVDATGNIDLGASASLDILRQIDLNATWDIEKFAVEDVRIDDSQGKVNFTVAPRSGDVRAVTWDVDASAYGVVAAGNELHRASVKSSGSTRFEGSAIEARYVLGALSTTVDADVDSASWSGGKIGAGHVLATVKPTARGLDYELKASVDKLDAGPRIDALAAQLAGEVQLGKSLDWPGAVSAVSVRGDVAGTGIDLGGDQGAGQIAVRADIAGPLGDLGGIVDVNATDLSAGGFDFTTVVAKLAFTGKRNFRIDADGVQRDKEPQNIGLIALGRYSRDLTDYTILDLQLKTVGDAWEMSGEFSADTSSGVFTFRDLVLSRGEQRVAVDGEFRQGRDQDLVAQLQNVDLGELSEQFGLVALEPLEGKLEGTVRLAGTHSRPIADFRLVVTGLIWEGIGPFDVELAGGYDNEELRLGTIDVRGYETHLVEGTAQLPIRVDMGGGFELRTGSAARANLTLPDVDLAAFVEKNELLDSVAVTGSVGARISLAGSLDQPVLRLDAKADNVGASGILDEREYQIGPANVDLEAGYLPLSEADAGLRARAAVAFQEEPPMTLEAGLQAPIAEWVMASLEGESIDWMARLESAPIRLEAKSERFDLRNLRFGALQAADMEGLVDLALDARGTLNAPEVDIELSLADFGWERYRDVYVDLSGSVDQDQATVRKLTLEWDGDPILRASGRLPAPFALVFGEAKLEELPLDFQVELLPLPLQKFSAVDYAFAALKGQVSGFARFAGTLQAPAFSGRFSAVDVEFADKTRGTVAAEFAAKDNRVTADLLICQGPKPVLVGALSAPVQLNVMEMIESQIYEPLLPGDIAASLKGNVQLAGLIPRKVLDDTVSGVAGTMRVDLGVSGTFDQPVIAGTLDIRDGAVFLAEYSRAFQDIQVDLEMTPEGLLTIDRLRVGDVRGWADASGTIRFDGLQPTLIDATATLDGFGTSGFTDLPAFVSAKVKANGDLSGSAASAQATISELEVVIPESSSTELHPTALDPEIFIVRPGRSTRDDLFSSLDSGGPVSSETYAQLRVIIERDSWIRHPFAEIEVKGDMALELAGTGATLGGEIQTVRGAAEVFGRRFVLKEGIVTFTGANPPDPLLQIEAEYEYDPSVAAALGAPTEGDPRATVRVTGRVSNPQIRFYSDPEMPESDVIYTLLTNRAPSQTEVGQGGAGNLAAGAASGLAAGFLQEQLQQVLPVQFDLFRVEAGDSGFADPTVEVGKYLFEDVFFSVEYKIGADQNENTSEFNIEYRFSPRWLFEFEAGNRGTGEANIFWDIY